MKRWITSDDFQESYSKLSQRGLSYFLSKLNIKAQARTQSTFDDTSLETANWWIVPKIRLRWNEMITGDRDVEYETYFIDKYCKGKSDLTLLSIGSGICSHEIKLAQHPSIFKKIKCTDIAAGLLDKASALAKEKNLNNIEFEKVDLFSMDTKEKYDIVLFHQSLHHFDNLEAVLGQIVPACLKENGLLLLNEYIGPKRLMWTDAQLQSSNMLLKKIPNKYRTRYKTQKLKTNISGPGYLRMLVSDPSEAVESDQILPLLEKHYHAVEQKDLGGNLLTLVLKDIAHHFIKGEEEAEKILDDLILAEDEFLKENQSDLIFGVYKFKNNED